MAIKTRREMKMELENYKDLVSERLQGRDIEKAVEELINKAEDVIIDEVGMPFGWATDDEDQQMAVLDIVAQELIKQYFTPQAETVPGTISVPTMNDI